MIEVMKNVKNIKQVVSKNGAPNEKSHSDSQERETSDDAAALKRFKILNLVGLGNYARVYRAIPTVANLRLSNSPILLSQSTVATSSTFVFPSPPATAAATTTSTCLNAPRELAIKSINLTKVSDNYRTKFLPRELSILKRVMHKNICKIYEIFQVAERIFIVMQFCSRGTIADLLQKTSSLSEPVARDLFVQVVDAVVYLHKLEMAHRDIKVENILLDANFVPKLTDFSYSVRLTTQQTATYNDGRKQTTTKEVCLINGKTTTTTNQQKQQQQQQQQQQMVATATTKTIMKLNETFCGTLPYLPPEMIRQMPYDSKKTDSWSLGVSLFVMLNDKIPFPITDVRLMVKKQQMRDFKFKANINPSDKCRDLIGCLLDPDFNKRLTSLEASKHPWMFGVREKPAIT